MFLTVHATAGALIGQQTNNAWLSFLLGFISHFILDAIPHGDQNLIQDRHHITPAEKKLIQTLGITDGLVMIALLTIINSRGLVTNPIPVIAGVIGAILPDYINALYIFFKIKWLERYFEFHYALHFIWYNFTITLRQGLIVQAIFLDLLLTVLLLLPMPSQAVKGYNVLIQTPTNQIANVTATNNTLVFAPTPLKTLPAHGHGVGESLADPSHHYILKTALTTIPEDSWGTKFEIKIKNAPELILHHALLLINTPDLVCPEMPVTNLYIAGADSPSLINLPPPYGIFIPGGKKIFAQIMVHNPEPPLGPGGTYYDVEPSITVETEKVDQSNRTVPLQVLPLRLSQEGCADWSKDVGPIFTVPAHSKDFTFGKPGVTSITGASYTFPVAGQITGIGGHLHAGDYGKHVDVYVNDTLIHSFVPQKTGEENWAWVTPPYIPFKQVKVKAGDVISITATYDNPTEADITDAMGMAVVYFAPNKQP